MSGYGILDYEGMNQAIYRGATSNIVVDTQKMGIGIGVDQNGPSSNLHVVGNTRLEGDINMIHTSNTSSMKVNSNVVTEFPRSKKLIRYPRVALTAASGESSGYQGYYVTESSNSADTNRHSWKAFDMTFDASTADNAWANDQLTNTYSGTDNAYNGSINLGTGAVNGEWIKLQLPHKIRLEYMKIWLRHTDSSRIPEDWILYGSNDNLNWTPLLSITGQGAKNENQYSVNATSVYDYFAVVVTKISGQPNYFRIVELEYFGLPEYDPDAAGMDVKVTSYPNVPNTDWLEVYYDAKESSSYPGTGGTVVDLSGNSRNGVLGGVTFDNGEIKAFDFSGAYTSNVTTSDHGLGTGDVTYSMAYWFKRTAVAGSYDYIVMLGDGGVARSSILMWINNDELHLDHWSASIKYQEQIILNKWYHVVAGHKGGVTPNVQNDFIYIDGKLSSIFGGGTEGNFTLAGSKLTLGSEHNGTTEYFNGKIANFRLFNRALTSDEVWQLYSYQKEYFGYGDLSMTLKAGRLGIGTSEPRATLDVKGTFQAGNSPLRFFVLSGTHPNPLATQYVSLPTDLIGSKIISITGMTFQTNGDGLPFERHSESSSWEVDVYFNSALNQFVMGSHGSGCPGKNWKMYVVTT